MLTRDDDVKRAKKLDLEKIHQDLMLKIQKTYDNLTASQIEYLAGMGAAGGATMITYPINKIIFRQSLWGFDLTNAIRQLKIEGISKLFRGCFPPLLTKSLNASVMFGTYNDYHNLLKNNIFGQENISRKKEVLIDFISGIASGSTEAILMPMERVQMLLQDGRLNNRYRNTIHVIAELQKYGFKEYYRGFTAVLLRNGPSTFLYFGLKDPLKDAIAGYHSDPNKPHHNMMEVLEFLSHFVSGAILGATISTLVFPLNVIRIHMQTQPVGTELLSIRRVFTRLVADPEGKKKLYAGIQVNALRSILYWGCITVFSESLRQHFSSESL